ncbi:MAG: helix-turn-helix domain-containing protein [Candidatus Omnitrophica bacterium]|nr:helix-turn-helix domain-containing protein [Candidatus Omnitrophota bacterium]MDD5488455.1 helix-turn-helix domain-containing protein [Candidatus Omnitrophota bacterium]
MKIGKIIKRLREKKKLTQLDLANALRVSPQAVSKWERDENHPDINTLVKFARMMEVSTDHVLGVNEPGEEGFKASVLVSSMNDFAVKSTKMGTRQVAEWANAVFYHMTESILKYDGVPVKYIGDGFLCFFTGNGHAERALKASIDIRKCANTDALVIAINTGDIYLGTIGHPEHSSKDIYGDAVNRTFLMNEEASKKVKSGIILSKAAKDEIKGEYGFKKHTKVLVGRLNEKIDIYEISG